MRLFCVCVVLCLGSGLATSRSLVQGVLPSVKKWLQNWIRDQGPEWAGKAIETIGGKFPRLSRKALNFLLPFAASYLCEIGSQQWQPSKQNILLRWGREMTLERPFQNSNLSIISYVQKGNHIRPINPGVKRVFYFSPLNQMRWKIHSKLKKNVFSFYFKYVCTSSGRVAWNLWNVLRGTTYNVWEPLVYRI
jgi:hypothetical protein